MIETNITIMNNDIKLNDFPIENSNQDLFGHTTFAQVIASSVEKLDIKNGAAIAITGAWGSGKTGIINLVKNELQRKKYPVEDFNCWWSNGTENLISTFLTRIYYIVSSDIDNTAKDSFCDLISYVSLVSDAALMLHGMPAPISIATNNIINCLRKQPKQPLEDLYKSVCDALRPKGKTYIIVLDDIDRMPPDDAYLLFKLIRTVGMLPNIIYLLSYDKNRVAKFIQGKLNLDEKSGQEYLEKIVQLSFNVPKINFAQACDFFIKSIKEKNENLDESDLATIFDYCLRFDLQTPRAIKKLVNEVFASYDQIFEEVNFLDFLCITFLRLFYPTLYTRIQHQKENLCAAKFLYSEPQKEEFANNLFKDISSPNLEAIKRLLGFLFPHVSNIFKGLLKANKTKNRVSYEHHFDAYFRYGLSENDIPSQDFFNFKKNARDEIEVEKTFREYLIIKRLNGDTKASILLDDIYYRTDEFSKDAKESILKALFKIGNDFDIKKDTEQHYSVSNIYKVFRLAREIVKDLDTTERDNLILSCLNQSSLDWIGSVWKEVYYDNDETSPRSINQSPLVSLSGSEKLKHLFLEKVKFLSKHNNFFTISRITEIISNWDVIDETSCKDWLYKISNDQFIYLVTEYSQLNYGINQFCIDTLKRIFGSEYLIKKTKNLKDQSQIVQDLWKKIKNEGKTLPQELLSLKADRFKTIGSKGHVEFFFEDNNGIYILENENQTFKTKWSRAGNDSIHAYGHIGVYPKYKNFPPIKEDFVKFNFTSQSRTIKKGDIFLLTNENNDYVAIQLGTVESLNHGHVRDRMEFDYKIYE